MACRVRCGDPTKKENLKEVMPQVGEVYNGLLDHFGKKKQCKRMPEKINAYPPKIVPNQERLEALIEEAMKRIEIREEIRKILWEEEQANIKDKRKPVEPSEYVKHPCKCESRYDWSYVKGHAGDARSSPSLVSLRSSESYIVLPKDVKEELKKTEGEGLPCEQDFIEYPRHGHRIVGKRLPPDKDLILKAQIENLENQFRTWKTTKKHNYYSNIKKKELTLFDKINFGHEPNLHCKKDLISLLDKIKPSPPKLPKDIFLTCRDCFEFEDDCNKSPFFVPNTFRQLEVLTRFTPTEHEHMSLQKRKKLGMKVLEQKSKLCYGSGPTLWKCNRIEDTFLTEGKKDICEQAPCVCPEKPKSELKEVKKALEYPTFITLSVSDRRILKCSWKNRGISKSTLIMLWFDKLFRRDPDNLHLQIPGQSIDALFMDEENLKYMDQLATILDLAMTYINKPDIVTKLICEIGYIHSCLDVKESFFETLKETLLETFIENFNPKLKKAQVAAWENFFDTMFDLVRHCFLWNKWPPSDLCGTKEMIAIDESKEEPGECECLSSSISTDQEDKASTTEEETTTMYYSPMEHEDECQELRGEGYAQRGEGGEEGEYFDNRDYIVDDGSIKVLKNLSLASMS